MSLKQFWSVLLMSVLILAVSAMLTYVRDEVFAQQGGLPVLSVPVQSQPPKWLVSFERLENQNVQQVIIVDPETQRIGVYHVGLESGRIQLVNIRHINADLQMRIFDAAEPLPQDIEQHYLGRRGNP
ncbi:MAG: hypothetical protein FWC43_03545 [Planctomycetaceae bacterium]|nr:hypothetical protein [Planctomycetaceae bacterium]